VGAAPAPTPSQDTASAARRAAAGAVFGLPLGDQLRVPVCKDDAARDTEVLQSLTSPGATPRQSSTTCRFAPQAMNGSARLFAQRLANVTSDPLPAGVDFSLVSLASQRCPDWVNAAGSCVVGVTTKDGAIIGVSYLAGDDTRQSSIEKSLSETYAVTPRAQAAAACQDPKAGARASTNRFWDGSGLRVSYFPTGGLSCRQGRVLVETDTMRQLLAAPGEKQARAKP
jgi:hypothetical protein